MKIDAVLGDITEQAVDVVVNPSAISCARSARTASIVAVVAARGFDFGRVDCFSTASQPPTRQRPTSLPTHTVEIPYWRATAPWD